MTDTNADNAGTQTTDAGTQQNDATNANATDASQQGQQAGGDTNASSQNTQTAEKAVPEKYEFTMPDGVTVDVELAEELGTVAKELKLDQTEAQKFADLGGKLATKMAAKQAEMFEQTKSEWKSLSQTDKEFGGDKLAVNLATANKTFATFGTPELRELLDKTGLGDHPEVIRWAYRVGQAISEDKIVTGDTAQKVERNPADILFPTMKSA